MDIRTKLAIVLVAVSLTSMWLLGFFAYRTSATLLQEISERQLDALAESKARDVEKVIESWRDHARLIASRTQLRLNLAAYNDSGEPDLLDAMGRILTDALSSTPSVSAISLYSTAGERLLDIGRDELVAGAPAFPDAESATRDVAYLGAMNVAGDWFVEFATPLLLQEQAIGRLHVAFRCDDLETVSQDYSGLGKMGETIIVRHDSERGFRLLHALRHGDDGPVDLDASGFLTAAVNGTQGVFTAGQVDYRHRPVWAATRFIEDVGWGLAVQVNRNEELGRVRELRESMVNLGLSLSSFAIVGGTLLGIYLARPLRRLAEVVERVRDGETGLRAEVRSEDEIGLLSRALNEFLDAAAPAPRDPP